MDLLELLPFVLIGGVFWLLVMRPAKARRDAHNRLMAELAPGARIMTTAGLFGTVTEVGEDRLRVEVAPGVVLQMVPQAIAKVLPDEPDPEPALDAGPEAHDEVLPETAPEGLPARDGEPGQGATHA